MKENNNYERPPLLQRAYDNLYQVYTNLSSNDPDNPALLRFDAFCLSQAIEMGIKAYLEYNGANYDYTHDISDLLSVAFKNGLYVPITNYFHENPEVLTVWESKSRYGNSFNVEKNRITHIYNEAVESINNIEKEFIDDFNKMKADSDKERER